MSSHLKSRRSRSLFIAGVTSTMLLTCVVAASASSAVGCAALGICGQSSMQLVSLPADPTGVHASIVAAKLEETSAISSKVAQSATEVQAPSLPRLMVAAGDSITRGYNSTNGCLLTDCPQYSWATGNDGSFASVAGRLKAAGQGVTVLNVAKTGSKMKDLGAQLQKAAADNADFVTILMGANDLCVASVNDMTPVATFTSQFRGALANFMAAKPGAYVHVSSMPNLANLYNLMSTKTAAKVVWAVGRMCPSMLSLSESNAERSQVAEREVEFNNALKSVCATFTHCRYDNGAAYSVKFTEADVSTIDYFHPSPAGQAKLAAAEWASGFWPAVA